MRLSTFVPVFQYFWQLIQGYVWKEQGKYRILVKVIDIFGNDTTQLLEVSV